MCRSLVLPNYGLGKERCTLARVGFIGLGRMGKPMARRLIQAGHELTVWGRRPGPVQELAALGAGVAAGPADMAGKVDILFTCVTTPEVVESLLCGPEGAWAGAPPGTIFIDTSTIGPADAQRIAGRLQPHGIDFLDCPLSGGPWGAQEGTLTLMIGGEPSILERVRPILQAFAGRIHHLGPVGAGQVAKLCNNLLVAIHTAAAAEAFVLATKGGIDPVQFLEVVSGATGQSAQITRSLPKFVLPGQFAAAFSIDHLHKDVGLACDLGRELGVRLLVSGVVNQLTTEARSRGLGDQDIAALFRTLEELAGVQVRDRSAGAADAAR